MVPGEKYDSEHVTALSEWFLAYNQNQSYPTLQKASATPKRSDGKITWDRKIPRRLRASQENGATAFFVEGQGSERFRQSAGAYEAGDPW